MRYFLAHARSRQAWSGLTMQQYNVLRIIQLSGPQSPVEVARRLQVSAPVVTRLASSLLKSELLIRLPDGRDRRAVRLELSPAGRTRVRAMRRDLLAAAGELLSHLPEDRRDTVALGLRELQNIIYGTPKR